MRMTRELELLDFISCHWVESGGAMPSVGQIAEAVGYKSKSSVHRVLRRLEARGFIRRVPEGDRAVVERPRRRDGAPATCAACGGPVNDRLKAEPR